MGKFHLTSLLIYEVNMNKILLSKYFLRSALSIFFLGSIFIATGLCQDVNNTKPVLYLEKKPIEEKKVSEPIEEAPEQISGEADVAPLITEESPTESVHEVPATSESAKETPSEGKTFSDKTSSIIDLSGLEDASGEKPIEGKLGPNDKISLDYKDADLSSVLRALSYSYSLNLVALKDIKGKVTISLRDVTVDEALEAILSTNGYAYTRKGSIIYISPGPSAESQGMITKSIGIKFVPVDDAYKLLSKILSDKGSMSTNEANSSLIVTDYPATFERINMLLKEIDVPPMQVVIEAKIVDLQADAFSNIGVTYSANYSPGRGLFDRATRFPETVAGTTTLAGPSSDLTGGQFKLTTFTLKNFTASATVDALIRDGKAHLLASPSITTLNGKEARIVIGQRVPYKEKTTTTTGTVENTKFIDVGTTLKVLPRISSDGFVTMNIHPEVSSLVSNDATTGPTVNTREADVTVRVVDGETIVIGGLIKSEDNKTVNRIPVLGYIPVVGYLFSDRSTKDSQQELAVFITPHIIKSQDAIKSPDTKQPPEVVVDIVPTGKRNTAMIYFERAEDLRFNRGAESQYKDDRTRLMDAVDTYILVATQFPDSPKADESLYRAGEITYKNFKDYQNSKQIFEKLLADYPKSKFASSAKKMLKRIDKKINKKLN